MKEEVYRRLKINYQQRMEDKKNLELLQQELEALKNTKEVKRYLELLKVEHLQIPSEYSIISNLIPEVEMEYDSLIYVSMGAYQKQLNPYLRDNKLLDFKLADYFLYINIESLVDEKRIVPEEKQSFEEQHIILRGKEYLDVVSQYQEYFQMRNLYFQELLHSETYDLEKILSKIK